MQTTSHYHESSSDKRLDLMELIALTAYARREARQSPCEVAAVIADDYEAQLVDLANELFPHVAVRDFEGAVLAYDRSLS
jgi:hypothetical protein